MNPIDTAMVQCFWHHSHSISPFWKVEKADGNGNYYIMTHCTYWSGGKNRYVPDSSYLTIETEAGFAKAGPPGLYLVVHPR